MHRQKVMPSYETGKEGPEKNESGYDHIMKKNKKFQKEQLMAEGYEEIE